MQKRTIAAIVVMLSASAFVAGRAVLAAPSVEPVLNQVGPGRFGADKSHTFSTHDRFVVSTVVSERVVASAVNGPCRMITAFCLLENDRVRRGKVVCVQDRPLESTVPVSAGLGYEDGTYSFEMAPAAGLTWGTVASEDDLIYSFTEAP